MSTRATYQFIDDMSDVTVYKHQDGYPEGGYQFIARALRWAWDLPRFEASEFAAAFVAACREKPDKDGFTCGGGVRLGSTRDSHGDTEYHYIVTCQDGAIHVERQEPNSHSFKHDRTWKTVETGTLDEMLDKYAPKREWATAP